MMTQIEFSREMYFIKLRYNKLNIEFFVIRLTLLGKCINLGFSILKRNQLKKFIETKEVKETTKK